MSGNNLKYPDHVVTQIMKNVLIPFITDKTLKDNLSSIYYVPTVQEELELNNIYEGLTPEDKQTVLTEYNFLDEKNKENINNQNKNGPGQKFGGGKSRRRRRKTKKKKNEKGKEEGEEDEE